MTKLAGMWGHINRQSHPLAILPQLGPLLIKGESSSNVINYVKIGIKITTYIRLSDPCPVLLLNMHKMYKKNEEGKNYQPNFRCIFVQNRMPLLPRR